MIFNFKIPKLFLSFVLLSFLNCSKRQSSDEVVSINGKFDSVTNWVSESKRTGLTPEERLNYLSKAKEKTENTENDSLKATYYALLSDNYVSTKDSLSFRKLNKLAINLNKAIGDSLNIAKSYEDLGNFYENSGVNDSAYYAYSEAQKLFDQVDEIKLSGSMFLNMAIIQIGIKDYTGSEIVCVRAIERFKAINDHLNLYVSYNVLGIALGALGETESSLAYYKEALYYLKQSSQEPSTETSILNNIGVVYRNNKQYTEAIDNFEQVLSFEKLEENRPEMYAVALSNLATARLYNKDTSGVNGQFLKAIELKKNNGQTASLAGTYLNYAEYKAYAKDSLTAIHLAQKAEELSKQSENNERLLETWAFLAELDEKNASKFTKKYIVLNDSLQKEERKQQNKFARIRFETDEFIAQNVELESEKEVLSKQKQMWVGIAAIFFLLGLSIYIIINQRAKNQKLRFDQQQQANNQEIFNLMLMQKQKVDEVKRMEQKRISEELHDGILGKMLGARMVLTGLNKRTTDEAIQEKSKALSSLQEIESEIRSISHELSHTAYQKINNFTDSIESLLESSSKNANIETSFSYNEDEDWDGLAGDIKINVYRIIQETFQNAIKHANCSMFSITFKRNDTHFNVIMSDNGSGFNPNKGKKGIGIRNISSRIHKLNGTWHMDSSVGQGTKTSLQIPLKKNYTNFTDTKKTFENV